MKKTPLTQNEKAHFTNDGRPLAILSTTVVTTVHEKIPVGGGKQTIGQIIDDMLEAKQADGNSVFRVSLEMPVFDL